MESPFDLTIHVRHRDHEDVPREWRYGQGFDGFIIWAEVENGTRIATFPSNPQIHKDHELAKSIIVEAVSVLLDKRQEQVEGKIAPTQDTIAGPSA